MHALVHAGATSLRILFQDRGERGARIFGVNVNASTENGLLANERSGEIELALDGELCLPLDLLSQDFSEDELLGEVLGANHNSVLTRGQAGCQHKREREEK